MSYGIDRSNPRLARAVAATVLLCGALGLLVDTVRAEPSAELVSWMHPDPAGVAGFRLLVARDESGRADPESIDVGLPRLSDRRGVYGHKVTVPERETLWVAVQAVDRHGRVSDPSEWRKLAWAPPPQRLGAPGWPYLVGQGAD